MSEKNIKKLFICDLNWTCVEDDPGSKAITSHFVPSAPHDWAFINPKEYFDWHMDIGNNNMFCQAYTWCGYAFYPSNLGPLAPGPGQELLPKLFELSKENNIPFWSYFAVSTDLIMSNMRDYWVVPGSREHGPLSIPQGYLAPESLWTDLLCERIKEFLSLFPVDWLLFDMFGCGNVVGYKVQPSRIVEKPFFEIIGREMPSKASEITEEEDLKYKREILSRQFKSIYNAVKKTSPKTKIVFNMPYVKAYDPLWVDSPVMNESDGLYTESTNEDIVNWLLKIKKPNQRVMANVVGLHDSENDKYCCNPNTWEKWYSLGCDIIGYAFGAPPDFRPHESFQNQIEVIRKAFKIIK